MIFWNSSEATSDATEHLRPLGNKAETEINGLLELVSLGTEWDGWKWAFIAIILSKEFEPLYTERVRRSSKNKVLEFRLKLDHGLFVSSSCVEQGSQYFDQLRRSVNLMAKWKMSPKDRSILLDVLKGAEAVVTEKRSYQQSG